MQAMADTENITNVTPLHPPQADRIGTATERKKKAAERARRYRQRKQQSTPPVTRHAAAVKQRDASGAIDKAPPKRDAVTVAHPAERVADATAYGVAIALASAAAWFSIRGMVVLFPGSPLSVIGMTCAMESAKLATAGWLARRWRATVWIWRMVLVVLVAGLAVINAAGVYAQLVAAHVGDRGAAVANVEVEAASLAARIEVQAKTVADLDTRVAQIDATIAEATRRGHMNVALSAIEGQRQRRQAITDERKREAGTLTALQTERAAVAAQVRRIETEAAPIRYVAAVFGVEDQETAIRWLIALMVLCCDPTAIVLVAAASARR
jgi:hypothetical protein